MVVPPNDTEDDEWLGIGPNGELNTVEDEMVILTNFSTH